MGIYTNLIDALKYDINKLENKNNELKKIIKASKGNSLHKKIRAFKSCSNLKDLLQIRKSVKRQTDYKHALRDVMRNLH